MIIKLVSIALDIPSKDCTLSGGNMKYPFTRNVSLGECIWIPYIRTTATICAEGTFWRVRSQLLTTGAAWVTATAKQETRDQEGIQL